MDEEEKGRRFYLHDRCPKKDRFKQNQFFSINVLPNLRANPPPSSLRPPFFFKKWESRLDDGLGWGRGRERERKQLTKNAPSSHPLD